MSLVTSHTCWWVKHVQKMVSALVYISHREQEACVRRIVVHRERTALEDPHRDVLALMVDFMLLKFFLSFETDKYSWTTSEPKCYHRTSQG
jgi:hypothetical protein